MLLHSIILHNLIKVPIMLEGNLQDLLDHLMLMHHLYMVEEEEVEENSPQFTTCINHQFTKHQEWMV